MTEAGSRTKQKRKLKRTDGTLRFSVTFPRELALALAREAGGEWKSRNAKLVEIVTEALERKKGK